MIRTKDLYDEIETLEKTVETLSKSGSVSEASIIKALVLQIKLLHNMRTNMVLGLKKLGVDLVKPKDKTDEEEVPTKRK